MEHTCIRDDGGTPGRKCYACIEESKARTFTVEQVVMKDGFGILRYGQIIRVKRTPDGLTITVRV